MRVRLRGVRRRDEDGVIVIFVAMALIALMAMVVLAVDMGAVLLKRRQMVNAGDAASLAAAQTCAGSGGTAALATAQADLLATSNVDDASRAGTALAFTPDSTACGSSASGSVTVHYASPQELFFAPVLGFDSDTEVVWDSTAIWGTAKSGPLIPIEVDLAWLTTDCQIPIGGGENSDLECFLLWDNNSIGSSTWGTLSPLPEFWGVDPSEGSACNGSNAGGANAITQVIDGGGSEEDLSVPAYVCATNGLQASVWMALEDWIGEVLLFPVTDPALTIPDPAVFGSDPNYQPDIFYVETMVPLLLNSVGMVDKLPDETGTCTVTIPGPVAGGATIDLAAAGEAAGCFTGAPKSISGVTVTTADLVVLQQGKDYGFNPSSNQLSLKLGVPGGVSVSFSWTKQGQFTCGDQTASNASAVCIEAEWGGDYCCAAEPEEGVVDLGVRAIRLSKAPAT